MKTILFDLDGTLTDPKEGIVNCFEYALERMNVVPDPETDFTVFIGPPLERSFAELIGTDDRTLLETAVRYYRERYRETGQYENVIYPGVCELLGGLKKNRHRLFLATSKLELFAAAILSNFRLNGFFNGIYGSMPDGSRADKGELIRHIIEAEHLDPETVIMVGDRNYDIAGATANGIRSVGVLWGYGSRYELETAGASCLCAEMEELGSLIADL